jgi:hypothetical protein
MNLAVDKVRGSFMKSGILKSGRYFVLLGFAISNLFLFQNCSNWEGKVSVSDRLDKLGFDEQIIPVSNNTSSSHSGGSQSQDGEFTESNPCTNGSISDDGSCECASGQKLSEKNICYTPAADICANKSSIVTTTETIVFEEHESCEWETHGNLSRLDGKIRARYEQLKSLSIPSNYTICSMNFTFENNQKMVYDDHVIMTYNDIVFSTTESNLLGNLKNKGTTEAPLYKYNWASLLGEGNNSAHASSTNIMCLDSRIDHQCNWPKTQKSGTIEMTIDPNEIQRISDLSVGRTDKTFGFITTGDNDDSDCGHSAISFKVVVEYVKAP